MSNSSRQPLVEELTTGLSPLELFELFQSDINSFFLDSAMDPQKLGRFSLLGTDPFLLFKSSGQSVTIEQPSGQIHLAGNPFDLLGRYLETYRLDDKGLPVPCTGGAVGYFSYDLARFIEKLPERAVDDLQLPESCFGFYDVMLVINNLSRKTYLVSTGFPEIEEPARLRRAASRLSEFKSRMNGLIEFKSEPSPPPLAGPQSVDLRCNFTHPDYVRAVDKARQYIIDGDIFEVNLSQRYTADITVPPWELYRRLRRINPAPFSSYLNFTGVKIAGSSPERFLRLRGDLVETRPVKGTVRRGKTPEDDGANAAWLLQSAKDRAENMMIVDLERNDLGRVCRYGTVKVTELAVLETFPTVYHLTSTVVGRLRENVSRIDLLKATFPGGSITGAPKIRAMEIIDELEPTRRSVYTGCIGYLSFNGNIDLNIVIRTFLIKGRRAYFQLGGAVVYDSDPESEYQETLDKGKALFDALTI
jgi:para-aminobenzoate synthetase component 1